MKLQELAATQPTKQIAKVFESYFGKKIAVENLTESQAKGLLSRVRKLISEHRRTPGFHRSEQNPAYLKLVMMEQALSSFREAMVTPGAAANPAGTAAPGQPNQQQMAVQVSQSRKQIQDQIKAKQEEIRELQQQMNNPSLGMAESRRRTARRLAESEVAQAQVVLASQDMVDQVQKMLEQVSAMQFKDLPALVDQVKNQVGVEQAMQFNTDASAALTGLVQNLQASKGQLEQALGVVTGQAPVVPGEEAALPAPEAGQEEIGLDAELPTADGEEDIDAEMDANIAPTTSLGRDRR